MKEKIAQRLQLFKEGKTIKEIAELQNVSSSSVVQSLNKNGITVRRKNSDSKLIYDDFKNGMSLEELKKKYNTNVNGITWHLKKFENVSFKKSYKDNTEKINKVLQLYKEGYSLFKICKLAKITDRYVKQIFKDNGIVYENKPQFRKKHINENIFDIIDTQEKAYWLGMLYADGYITSYHKKGDGYCVELCLKDKEHIEKFIKFLGDKEHKPTKKIVKLNEKEFIEWRYNVYSKQLSTSLIKNGCLENKSLILTFPNEDIVPKNLLCHFIRGYTDGDGTVAVYRLPHYSLLGTKEFLDKVVDIFLEKELITNKPKYQMNGKAYSFTRSGKQVAKIINYLHPKDTTIHLDRKYEKYAVLLGEE